MMNKFKMVLGCVALSLLPGGILAVVLSGPNDALFYGYFVVALPFLIMLYMGVGSLLLGILIFGIKLMGWSSRAFLIVGMFIAVIAIYALRVMVVDDLPLALPIAVIGVFAKSCINSSTLSPPATDINGVSASICQVALRRNSGHTIAVGLRFKLL